MRIAYLDTFCKEHSGRFWMKAFEAYGPVQTTEISGLTQHNHIQAALQRVIDYRPDHIHFGGSTQGEKTFTIHDVIQLKNATAAKLTFFYGDGYYNLPYYLRLATFVDGIYVTNKNFCQMPNIRYTLCPAPRELAVEYNDYKRYDLGFIGNNYNEDRREAIYALDKMFPGQLVVFGKGWKKRKINTKGEIAYEQFADVCQQVKIVLGDPAGPICLYSHRECGIGNPDKLHTPGYCRAYSCSKYAELEGYVSNRVANILMTGSVCLMPYTKGIEDIFENGKHLVWFKTFDEMKNVVQELLTSPKQIKQIGKAGQDLVLQDYTFESVARRILTLQ